MINRHNILDLIGKHKGKYHSCVLSCYSLDFSFFEERVLPVLRLANIKNVNILSDGYSLEQAQEMTTGTEFKYNKSYNFQPIYVAGVFHPKILLLTGAKHGLLLIGSGNITSAGLSTNDEIWGAFHLDNLKNENAPLFGAVWLYLQSYLSNSLGFTREKYNWIKIHSPWVNHLPVSDDWIDLNTLNLKLKFLSNNAKHCIFEQMAESVPVSDKTEITTIAPYYDKNGGQIKQLVEHYRPANISCIIDSNFGILPTGLDSKTGSKIKFYDWKDCIADFDNSHNRLHAKIINIRNKDEEYLLLGSPNLSIAAMGGPGINATNAEAAILLQRAKAKSSWLAELGIKIPRPHIVLQETGVQSIVESNTPKEHHQYKVLYAELEGNEIQIYLNKTCTEELKIVVLDRIENEVNNNIIKRENEILTTEITSAEDVFKLSLYINETRVSNFCLIHRRDALMLSNPDPVHEKLNALFEQDFIDGEGITDLLQFVDYNWADTDEEEKNSIGFRSGHAREDAGNQDENENFEVLEAADFNKISREAELRQSGELSNTTVIIADFLAAYTSGALAKESDFTESEEQKLFEDKEQLGEGDEVTNATKRYEHGRNERSAMVKYFKRLNNIYDKKLKRFIDGQAITALPDTKVNISFLSGILIALHLILMKYGKKYNVLISTNKKNDERTYREERYLYSGPLGVSVDTIKGVLVNVLGKFLLLCSAGYKEYEYDILNKKLKSSRFLLLVKSTTAILNTDWHNNDEWYRDVLLLNCMHFTLGNSMLDNNEVSTFLDQLESYKLKGTYVSPEYKVRLDEFKDTLLPDYINWLRAFNDIDIRRKNLTIPVKDLKLYSIIFNSKIGFNIVEGKKISEAKSELSLSRPGYPFEGTEFALDKVQFLNQCIIYSENNV